jgi:hypothetical protein
VLVGVATLLAAPAPAARAQSVWELTPYRIRVILAAAEAPGLSPRLQADLSKDLVARVHALIGASWDIKVGVAVPSRLASEIEGLIADVPEVAVAEKCVALRSAMLASLHDVTIESLPKELLDDAKIDKLILLAVVPGPTGYRAEARELDLRVRMWSTPVAVSVWQPAKLCDAALRAVRAAFAPLAQVTSVDLETKQVTLRLRAGGFPLRDEAIALVEPGDLFRPVLRHLDQTGKLAGVNAIDWTYLVVQKNTPMGLACKMHSGFRTPISGRVRGRKEQLALGVHPPHRSTTLTLRSRTRREEVLAGYDVYSHAPDSETSQLIGRTDLRGSLAIPPNEQHPLRVLLVKHGGKLLARLPLVPGIPPEIDAEVANDDQRLYAEGFAKGLQDELIDMVVRGTVLLSRAQTRIAEKDFDRAKEMVKELGDLMKARDRFALRLTQERKLVGSEDKLVQAKITAMFNDTHKLLNLYLDPKSVEDLDRKLRAAENAVRATNGSPDSAE